MSVFKRKFAFLKMAAVLLPALALITGCNPKPKDLDERGAYAYGVQFGRNMKRQEVQLDPRFLAKGVVDGYTDNLVMTDQEIQDALADMSDERRKIQREKADVNLKIADDFIEKNKTAEDVQETASGLQYKIIEPGSGPSPNENSIAVVNYKVKLIDGTEVESTEKRGRPAELPLRAIPKGLAEGLQLLKKDGKAVFWIHPKIGYGDRQRIRMPPNSLLIYDVELVDVKSAPPAKRAQAPGAKRPQPRTRN